MQLYSVPYPPHELIATSTKQFGARIYCTYQYHLCETVIIIITFNNAENAKKESETLERFLEFIEQKKAGEEWEGELEGKVFELSEEWKKRRSGRYL